MLVYMAFRSQFVTPIYEPSEVRKVRVSSNPAIILIHRCYEFPIAMPVMTPETSDFGC